MAFRAVVDSKTSIPFFIGFLILANFYFLPHLEKTPRVSDFLGVAAYIWVFWRLIELKLPRRIFCLIVLFFLFFLIWAIIAVANGWTTTLVLSVRWLLALPVGYAVYEVLRSPDMRCSFIWGLFCGAAFNVAVLAIQFFGYKELTQDMGLAAQDSALCYIYGTYRTPGMHGHPNAAMAVVSLIVPASLWLTFRENKGPLPLFCGFILLYCGGMFTLTRAAVVVSLLTMVMILLVGRMLSGRWARVKVCLVLLLLTAASYCFGPPGGWERWLDTSNLEVNFGARFGTNAEGLAGLISNPFGLGWEATKEGIHIGGVPFAAHNAFIHAGLVFGLPFALVTFVPLAALVVGFFGRHISFANLLALHFFGLCFWEEHFNNPSMIILCSWLITYWALSLRRPLALPSFFLLRRRVQTT